MDYESIWFINWRCQVSSSLSNVRWFLPCYKCSECPSLQRSDPPQVYENMGQTGMRQDGRPQTQKGSGPRAAEHGAAERSGPRRRSACPLSFTRARKTWITKLTANKDLSKEKGFSRVNKRTAASKKWKFMAKTAGSRDSWQCQRERQNISYKINRGNNCEG